MMNNVLVSNSQEVFIVPKNFGDLTAFQFPDLLSVITVVDQDITTIILPTKQSSYKEISIQNNKLISISNNLNVIIGTTSINLLNYQSFTIIYYGNDGYEGENYYLIYDSSIEILPPVSIGNYVVNLTNPGPPFATLTPQTLNTIAITLENDISFGFDIIIPQLANSLEIGDRFNIFYSNTAITATATEIYYQLIDVNNSSPNIVFLIENRNSLPQFTGLTGSITLLTPRIPSSYLSYTFTYVSSGDIVIRLRQFAATTGAGSPYENGSFGRLVLYKLN